MLLFMMIFYPRIILLKMELKRWIGIEISSVIQQAARVVALEEIPTQILMLI